MARANSGEDAVEHEIRQITGYALFVVSALLERTLMERAPFCCARNEGVPPEQEDEHLQPVAALGGVECEQAVVVSGEV